MTTTDKKLDFYKITKYYIASKLETHELDHSIIKLSLNCTLNV